MFGLKPVELLIIAAILLLLFGAKRLPELARSIGTSLKTFKRGLAEDDSVSATATPAAAPAVLGEKRDG